MPLLVFRGDFVYNEKKQIPCRNMTSWIFPRHRKNYWKISEGMELRYMRKFENYCSNLSVLEKAYKEDIQNEFIVSGIIYRFSVQFEFGLKVLKELVLYEGSSIGKKGSPRDIIKVAYHLFDFIDETVWLHMLKDRNDTCRIYNGDMAKELAVRILKEYIPVLVSIRENISSKYKGILREGV